MYPVQTMSSLCVLTLSVLLALRFGGLKADEETVSITLECGDIKHLTSPNYPDNYNNNLEIHWDVRADLAQRIVVTFDDFHTENSDYLYVKEENYPSSKARYSGSKAAKPYISIGNHLVIIFISDYSESRPGFLLSLSCSTQTENTTYIHEALEGSELIRVLTQPVCRNAWHMDVADTICREAGFPGAYETTWSNTNSGLNETSYNCNSFTYRLQDCKNFTSSCTDAYTSVVINCNDRNRCKTTTTNPTGHWATFFNASFGFCSEPAELDNGSWSNTLNGFMYGTTITAKCNETYELVGEDRKIRCDKATTSTTQDFEWHGTIPSCLKSDTEIHEGPADDESLSGSDTCKSVNYCAIPLSALVPVVILLTLALISVLVVIVVEFVLWLKR